MSETNEGVQAGLDEAVLEVVVRRFYAAAREDALIGPVFDHVKDWEHHIARICAFWSSVALRTGRYEGQPMRAHMPLGLEAAHFQRWLMLFRQTVREVCTPAGAALLEERAGRIAQGLLFGIESHRGVLPARG